MTKQGTPEEFWARAQAHEQTEADLRADLAVLESQAGGVMLDDPGAAEALVGRVASLRARADLEGEAAVEARKRAQAARVAGLRGEADGLEPEVARIRRELSAYQVQRDKLLKALEEFTRAEWALKPEPDRLVTASEPRPPRPDEILSGELRAVEQRQAQLRSRADAVESDPEWVPDSVRSAQEAQDEWAALVRDMREWAIRVSGVRAEIARLEVSHEDPLGNMPRTAVRLKELRRDASSEGFFEDLCENADRLRAKGLVLSDAEVRALAVEVGLDVPVEFAGEDDSDEVPGVSTDHDGAEAE
ncbi:hypothetical protein [Janibacter indicus]|uniref:hypothetical protein n=1 Tax=Janibacter indicus TaxID=857417 RepID=UPI003D9A5F25